MLLGLVIGYWIASIALGLWATRFVRTSADFAVAGRSLPFPVVTATVFATWFGSEVVLGVPAVFLKEGLRGVVADPFGSSMCLILVGLFFAAPLYRQKLLTIGAYYKLRFGPKVELLVSMAIILSYLGWVGAQVTALGLVFNVVSGGSISLATGLWVGTATIVLYTFFGGMWAIAVTDFVQMIVIVVGMLWIGTEMAGMAGGVGPVIAEARAAGRLELLPKMELRDILAFTAAGVTMMLGSIPQQDVFQRVQSSKTIQIAVWASVLGGVLYFCFAFVPMFLASTALKIAPAMVEQYIKEDAQMILPRLVLDHAPFVAQVMFFGALLSAIKSCAAATLLAPSVMFTENILKPALGGKLDDKKMLLAMRCTTAVFAVLVAIYASNSKVGIFKMVENAYQVTLVAAFIPLLAGVYWKRATTAGALASIFAGLTVWIGIHLLGGDEPLMPAQLGGLLASALAMVVVSLLPIGPRPVPMPTPTGS